MTTSAHVIPTVKELRHLEVMGPSRNQPFGASLTEEEARHLQSLLCPEKAPLLVLRHTDRGGSDGEEYWYIGIERKEKSRRSPNRKYRRVYECYFLYYSSPTFFLSSGDEKRIAQRVIMLLKEFGADCGNIRNFAGRPPSIVVATPIG